MEALFERAIGDDWTALHRRLRERYGLVTGDGHVAIGRGVMRELRRSGLAVPVLWLAARDDFLFPEAGRDIAFSITSEPFVDANGNEALVLDREFETSPPRTFVDTLRWNPVRGCITNLFGRYGFVAADVHLGVDDGDLILSVSAQWLRVGSRYLRLPGFVAAGAHSATPTTRRPAGFGRLPRSPPRSSVRYSATPATSNTSSATSGRSGWPIHRRVGPHCRERRDEA